MINPNTLIGYFVNILRLTYELILYCWMIWLYSDYDRDDVYKELLEQDENLRSIV